MNEGNTKYLIEKYPHLWGKLRMGFECGDGWFTLVETVSRVVGDRACYEDFVIVKEKFGGLRIQGVHGKTIQDVSYVYGVISMAEAMSFHVCEICGLPGTRGGTGHIQTLCEEHRK